MQMTESEIKTNILQAKDQIAQIVICAELNGVSTEKIKDILRKQGVDLRTLKGDSSNYWVKKEKTVDPVPAPDNDKIIKQLFNRVSELTDSNVAANLKSNYEGLQRVGIEPSVMDLRYVRLAKLEDKEPKYKELLRLAMSDLEDAEDCDSCIYDSKCCPGVTGDCTFKWKHHDEAMQLLGEED